MTDKEAKKIADKILNCGHNTSLICWKSCNDCKNNYNLNDVISLAKYVKEQKNE